MADPAQKSPTEAQAYIARLENTLEELAEFVGASLGFADTDTIRRRMKDIRTERDTAQARVSELEKTLEAARSAIQTYASAEKKAMERATKAEARVKELEGKLAEWKLGAHTFATRAERLEAEVASLKSACPPVLHLDPASAAFVAAELGKISSAGIVEPANDYTAEVHAARIDALKTLGVNPYDPPVCIPGAAKKRAKTLEHARKFEDELAKIWELWGAGRPMTPGCVYDAALEMEQANTKLHMKLGAIAEMLSYAGIPTHYGADQQGGAIPLPERVAVLIIDNADADQIDRAHAGLDDLGAPRQAGSVALDLSARIRALPGLLRQD